MRNTKLTLAFTLGLGLSVDAHAAITGPITIDFLNLTSQLVGGLSNLMPDTNGNCPSPNTCYYEDGMAIGVVYAGHSEHLHRVNAGAARSLQYHDDATGYYVRAVDGSAFNLLQMDFQSAYGNGNGNPGPDPEFNPLSGGNYWEILGFSSAINPLLSSGDGTHYDNRVAYQQVENGYTGPLLLDPAFQNINAFWIHFVGFPRVPGYDGFPLAQFGMALDNVKIAAPVPAPAAVWLMGSGLLGLLGTARRKAKPAFEFRTK